jgi:DNA topoisomerase VI subunit A
LNDLSKTKQLNLSHADHFVQSKYNGKAIIVTGCGFPDVQTRVLLNR